MSFRIAWFVTLGLLLATAYPASARKSTDSTGKLPVEDDLVHLNVRKAILKKTEGKVIAGPIDRLSAADRRYLATLNDSSTNEPVRPTPQSKNQTTTGPIVAARSNRYHNPRTYHDEYDDTTSCENGIWRIRPTKIGIIWFDFYHAEERKWYVNKNNLNLMTLVEGSTEWQNTELDHVQPSVEIVSEGGVELHLRYHFDFPNKAEIYTDMFMQKGSPDLRFEVHQKADSKRIIGFQWHVTFGQAEAVSQLHFGGKSIYADKLPQSFPGSRLKVQLVRWYRNQRKLDFKFSGRETTKPDPKNPSWMTRVLGLEQHVTWGKPMRPQDHFAFEARDQPWQPDWKVPQTTPWIEGLWFIRNGPFLDGDQLTYGITNLKDYLRKENRKLTPHR